MKLRVTYLLALIALLSGCAYTFELDQGAFKDKLYVQCIAGGEDGTFINVQKASPHNSEQTNPALDIQSIILTRNGTNLALTRLSKAQIPDILDVRKNYWYTPEVFDGGEELELIVDVSGFGKVKATTTVPVKPVIDNLEYKVTSDTTFYSYYGEEEYFYVNSNLEVTIPLRNYVEHQTFYGISVLHEYCDTLYYDGYGPECHNWVEYQRFYDASLNDDLEFGDTETLIPIDFNHFEIGFSWGSDVQLIKDGEKPFKSFTIITDFEYSGGYETTGNPGYYSSPAYFDGLYDREYSGHISNRYKIRLYAVSPEFYRYAVSRYLENNNYLGEAGLSPANFSYSNIPDGFGVFGSYLVAESPWFELERD